MYVAYQHLNMRACTDEFDEIRSYSAHVAQIYQSVIIVDNYTTIYTHGELRRIYSTTLAYRNSSSCIGSTSYVELSKM